MARAGEDSGVCGRANDDAFRLKPLPDRYIAARGLPGAEVRLFGKAKAAAEVEDASLGGVQSNRVMMRLTLPF